jgi:hypothetical protein
MHHQPMRQERLTRARVNLDTRAFVKGALAGCLVGLGHIFITPVRCVEASEALGELGTYDFV